MVKHSVFTVQQCLIQNIFDTECVLFSHPLPGQRKTDFNSRRLKGCSGEELSHKFATNLAVYTKVFCPQADNLKVYF